MIHFLGVRPLLSKKFFEVIDIILELNGYLILMMDFMRKIIVFVKKVALKLQRWVSLNDIAE